MAIELHNCSCVPWEDWVKKTLLLLVLALIATPSLVRADDDDDKFDRDDHHHSSVSAKELAGIGFAGAALIGLAGYAILRKRNLSA